MTEYRYISASSSEKLEQVKKTMRDKGWQTVEKNSIFAGRVVSIIRREKDALDRLENSSR